jgi:hypothetical protein
MNELPEAIPDFRVLLELSPEELASKILFILRNRNAGMFHPGNLQSELWARTATGLPHYPRERERDINQAVSEAFAWLQAQGLIVAAPDTNGQNGWRVLSRRARSMETVADFTNYKMARLLPRESCIPRFRSQSGARSCGASLTLLRFRQ